MAREFLGNIKGEDANPYVVDSGELIDDTGRHYYETYNNGMTKAWGYHIKPALNFDIQMNNGNYRTNFNLVCRSMVELDWDTITSQMFVDTRTTSSNIIPMTSTVGNPYSIRLMVMDTSPVSNIDVYINYTYIGVRT